MASLTFLELVEMKDSLVGVGRHQLPCGIEIAENLQIVMEHIRKANDLAKLVVEKYPTNGDDEPHFKDAESKKNYHTEIRSLNTRTYDVDIKPIPLTSELLKQIRKLKVEGTYLAPLLKTVFVEEERKEEA